MKTACFLIFAAALAAPLGAQFRDPYSGIQWKRGQDVVPAFEGWQRNTDGTYSMWFGYLNRNFEEEVDVPVGADNMFSPGAADQGQAAHFYTRRNMFVFKVIVPKDWPADRKLVWKLTTRGHSYTAKGWLVAEQEVNNGVISENMSGGVADPSNEAPTITGSGPQTVTAGQTVTLTVSATDDGIPKPRARRGAPPAKKEDDFNPIPTVFPEPMRRGPGLSIRWILFRGPGPVTFDPPFENPVYGKPVTSSTTAKFTIPGDYWLRAIASDSALESWHDIKVTVTPAR
jgi:hypothetical protein